MSIGFCLGEYDPINNVSMGYFGFAMLRTQVALNWNEKFGTLYSQLPARLNDMENFNKEMNAIIEAEGLEESPVLDFLLASDCEGNLNYKICRAILPFIPDNYAEFKDLVDECASSKEPLVWL